MKMRRCFTDPHYWKNPALRRSREKRDAGPRESSGFSLCLSIENEGSKSCHFCLVHAFPGGSGQTGPGEVVKTSTG